MSPFLLSLCVGLVFYLIISSIALYKVKSLKDQDYEISYKDALNPVKWFSVFLGSILSVLYVDHLFEQLVYRFYNPYCRENCLIGNEGQCVGCGCNTEAKMLVPFETCSKGYWGKFIWRRSEYVAYRKKFPIEIQIIKKWQK